MIPEFCGSILLATDERLVIARPRATEGLLSYTTPGKKFVALNLQLWAFRKRLRPRAMEWEVSQTSRE
jgi:hypothetical protein